MLLLEAGERGSTGVEGKESSSGHGIKSFLLDWQESELGFTRDLVPPMRAEGAGWFRIEIVAIVGKQELKG